MIGKRDVKLVLLHVLLGPLIGALVLFAAFFSLDALGPSRAPDGALLRGLLQSTPMVIAIAYTLGALPALLAGVANCFVARHRRGLARLGHALLWGGVTGAVGLCWLPFNGGPGPLPAWLFIALTGAAGAISSLVCVALYEWLGAPLPEAR